LNDSQAAQRVQNLRDQLEKLIAQTDELQKENKQLQIETIDLKLKRSICWIS